MEAEYPHLADLRELVALSALEPTGMHDLFEDFRLLTDAGLPIVRAEIDPLSAVPADGFRFIYKLADTLLVRLAALRARHVNAGEVKGGSSSHNYVAAIEITPDMICRAVETLREHYLDLNDPEQLENLCRLVLESALSGMSLAHDVTLGRPKPVAKIP